MGRRPAIVTQADIARAIRAVQAAGLPVTRVVIRGGEAIIETAAPPPLDIEPWDREERADVREPIVL